MPFTGAHPSIFLPFLRNKRISATGLIAGSISPDFEYFIKMSSGSEHSHTFGGLFYFDLPVSILIAIIFHQVIKQPLTENLPQFLKSRDILGKDFVFMPYLKKNYFIFICCALIGAASHLVWDAFTHNTWVTQQIPLYQMISLRVGELDYPLFYLLQQISTLLGTIAVVTYSLMQPAKADLPDSGKSKVKWFWGWIWSGSLSVLVLRFIFFDSWKESGKNQIPELGDAVVTIISAFLISLIFVSYLIRKSVRGQTTTAE